MWYVLSRRKYNINVTYYEFFIFYYENNIIDKY